ncbi:hypothetical protein V5G24_00140 [Xanthobacter sp. VTT E-85241]|uniref:hypothetical protein n=1 Tax=Roseixanthobacter finlandensis TaxID=3119922 RepID=UPI0037263872
MIASLIANWRLVAAGLALLGLAAGAITINNRAYERGYAARAAEGAALDAEKNNAATRADDDARRCSLDADCRMRNDGYKRD